MMLKKILLYVCLAGGAAAVACSGSGPSGSPTTPSGPGSPLNPDGSNLKIAAPGLNAPANGFTFPGVGKLVVRSYKARMGRNPQTGEAIKIPARKRLKFVVAKAAKDSVL